jgi:hypothetical protein
MTVDDIPIVDKGSGFDVSKYEGKRVKIAAVTKITAVDFYPDGETYNPDSKEMIEKLEIETEPLKELDKDGNNTDKDLSFNNEKITVTARFPLQVSKDSSGNKIFVISKHPKTKIWQFMRRLGITKPSEMIGKLVTLTSVPSNKPNDSRSFLRIVT